MAKTDDPQSILITGTSSGIGAALAEIYAGPGIFLALSGRNEQRLNAVRELCVSKGAQVTATVLDVADRKAMQEWIKETDSENPLDLVIANAGISGGTGEAKDGECFQQARMIFDINLGGVLNTIEPICPLMIKRGKGQIAIMSSLAGFRGWPGAPSYSASKGAVRFYGEALRGALKDSGVKINVICPGFVKSAMTDMNDYKMPFLMETGKAAEMIRKSLVKNRGRITFPLPTAFMAWLLSIFPDWLAQNLQAKMPKKPRIFEKSKS